MKPEKAQKIKHCLAEIQAEYVNLSVLAHAEDMKAAKASLWQGLKSVTELITILFPSDITGKTSDEVGDMVTVILDRQAAERDAKGGKDDE